MIRNRKKLIPVYLSFPVPHKINQANFISRVTRKMEELGLEVVNYSSANTQTGDVLYKIRDEIKKTYGLVAVAYERKLIREVDIYRDSDIEGVSQIYIKEGRQTSSYIHIETAMAIAYEKPVILMREQGLLLEGVIEVITENGLSAEFDLTSCSETLPDHCVELLINFSDRIKRSM